MPVDVPALTVNRLCGSGIQAAVSGAQMIQLGEARRRPRRRHGEHEPGAARDPRPAQRPASSGRASSKTTLWEALLDPYCGCTMAMTAENCAAKYGISREEQDGTRSAASSSPTEAWSDGRFADEVVPVEIKTRKGVQIVDRDDHMRPETTLEGLAKLPAAFKKDGTVTAGNASGIVDGGAALILASASAVEAPRPDADRAPRSTGPPSASSRR